MADVVEVLKAYKEETGLRSDQLAVKMDVPTSSFNAYLSQQRNLGIVNGRKILEFFKGKGDNERALIIQEYLLTSAKK